MQYDYIFRSRRSNVMAVHGMVAASQPLAAMAGLDMLKAGGTAADAAVAVAASLGVVEPFSTGIGGDCFALYWDAKTKQVYALNSSGPAPANASLDEIKQRGHSEMPLFSGESVSVPGTVRGWEALLTRFGRMSLADVLQPAARYAEEGYPVSEWIARGWNFMAARLVREDESLNEKLPLKLRRPGPAQASGYEFLKDGKAPQAGELMQLPTLAQTLRGIMSEGSTYIYEGAFAEALCAHMQRYGGWMEPADLAAYQPQWTEPIYADYHGHRLYECPPNGQGLAAVMAAKIADAYDLGSMNTVERTHMLIECMRLGFADALQWVSDPAFVDIPYQTLFSQAYITERRSLISSRQAVKTLRSGVLPMGDDTVYLSVVDGEGNACSFINSLYHGGGTGLVVPGTGVLLQNRAATFSLDPAHPNHLQGGKRPYQTIIPGMITHEGELYACFGVMGGFMQPQGHLQMLSNLVDLGYNPQQALDMPRFCLAVEGGGMGAAEPGGVVSLEEGFSFTELSALAALGHRIVPVSGAGRILFGGGQIILRDPTSGVLIGGSEPRKDGCALGY